MYEGHSGLPVFALSWIGGDVLTYGMRNKDFQIRTSRGQRFVELKACLLTGRLPERMEAFPSTPEQAVRKQARGFRTQKDLAQTRLDLGLHDPARGSAGNDQLPM